MRTYAESVWQHSPGWPTASANPGNAYRCTPLPAASHRVRQRAGDRCEYCRIPAWCDPLPFQLVPLYDPRKQRWERHFSWGQGNGGRANPDRSHNNPRACNERSRFRRLSGRVNGGGCVWVTGEQLQEFVIRLSLMSSVFDPCFIRVGYSRQRCDAAASNKMEADSACPTSVGGEWWRAENIAGEYLEPQISQIFSDSDAASRIFLNLRESANSAD